MKDTHNNILAKRAISPVNAGSGDTPILSQTIDRQGFESLEFVIATGSLADSDATFTVLIEDGETSSGTTNLSDNVAVDDKYLLGTEAEASFRYDDDNEVRKIGYIGNKRFVRMTITPSGNTGDVYLSAVALLGRPAALPVTQTAA